jgi:hypothetical protein
MIELSELLSEESITNLNYDQLENYGGVYVVLVNGPVPLLKIGHGTAGVQRSKSWLKTYPTIWQKNARVILNISRIDRRTTESEIHHLLSESRVARNRREFIDYIGKDKRVSYGEIKYILSLGNKGFDGCTEFFEVNESLNDFFIEEYGIDLWKIYATELNEYSIESYEEWKNGTPISQKDNNQRKGKSFYESEPNVVRTNIGYIYLIGTLLLVGYLGNFINDKYLEYRQLQNSNQRQEIVVGK